MRDWDRKENSRTGSAKGRATNAKLGVFFSIAAVYIIGWTVSVDAE